MSEQQGPCPTGGLGWPTLFTSMFSHGSWLHLLGNMWFLWIFGNNIEDSMGHLRFLAFFVLTGL
ncbi:MAG: rhomboid family intramembrane serine protease, partial [Gemmatimonadetes bacterium]|nr:rhomboid family intramembrane serine protease [Gemmatimonadota bacterium]